MNNVGNNSNLSFYYEGTSNDNVIAPWIEIGMIGNNQLSLSTGDTNLYDIVVTSTDPINGGIYTTCQSLVDPTLYPNQNFIVNYDNGNNIFTFRADSDFNIFDLRVDISRENYTPGSTITLTIIPVIT